MEQWKNPAKRNEWTDQVKVDLHDLGLVDDLNWIRNKSKLMFKSLVKKQVSELALRELLKLKENHTKMANLEYSSLEMQAYMKDKDITVEQAKIIFKFRTRMANFSNNFKGGKPTAVCPLCLTDADMQKHSYQCNIINKNIQVKGKYEDVFAPNIEKETAVTVENIVKFREQYSVDLSPVETHIAQTWCGSDNSLPVALLSKIVD